MRTWPRIELGGENYSTATRSSTAQPAAGLAIKLATGANALDTAKAVKRQDRRTVEILPARHGGACIAYDTTPFVQISIEEVVKTLFEGVVLVFLVMYLFLQNLRATLIPTIAVPVVLLGTFGVLAACGFSINTLTMFGLVLAIGLLVDDAIVVVENVERVMREEGLSPQEATRKSMGQITGALVGIALVLSAVFVPDGVLRRLDRRHLSAVLADHRRGDGAVGAGGPDLDAGAVRDAAQADRPRPAPREAAASSAGSTAVFDRASERYQNAA